jgi:hypothetical protein
MFIRIILSLVAGTALAAVTTSPNDTVILAPSTAVITSSAGNTWGISNAACSTPTFATGTTSMVSLNGVADTSTCNVVELAYVNGSIWQKNLAGNWYSKASATAAWSAGTATSPLPLVSTATLNWAAPTAYTSGAAITGALTYNVYQGVSGAALTKVQSGLTALSVVITAGLTAGSTMCFAVTAVSAGIESAQSVQACKAFAAAILTPMAPTLGPVS